MKKFNKKNIAARKHIQRAKLLLDLLALRRLL